MNEEILRKQHWNNASEYLLYKKEFNNFSRPFSNLYSKKFDKFIFFDEMRKLKKL